MSVFYMTSERGALHRPEREEAMPTRERGLSLSLSSLVRAVQVTTRHDPAPSSEPVRRRAPSLSFSRRVAAPVALPPGVVAEGFLFILNVGNSVGTAALSKAWKRRYFVLNEDGTLHYYRTGRHGVGTGPKGGAVLSSGDFFVADSMLRDLGFQISDLVTTFYLAAETHALQLDWMFKLRALLARCAAAWSYMRSLEAERK